MPLIALQVAACQGEAVETGRSDESCFGIGETKMTDVEWAPASDALVVQLSRQGGVTSVARLNRSDGAITEVAQFLEAAPASITIGPDEAVYWQRSDEGTTQLFREKPGQQAEIWTVPGVGFTSLEATVSGLVGSVLVRTGDQAGEFDLVDVNLRGDGTIATRLRQRIVGLQSVSIAPDGKTVAFSEQPGIGEPVKVSVSGSMDWSASLGDTTGAPISLTPDGARVMFVKASTGRTMFVDQTGAITPSALGTQEVLAFDIGRSGLIAAGSRNITGGPGAVCFA